jgi:hypothetical protein
MSFLQCLGGVAWVTGAGKRSRIGFAISHALQAMVKSVEEAFGRLGILVNYFSGFGFYGNPL